MERCRVNRETKKNKTQLVVSKPRKLNIIAMSDPRMPNTLAMYGSYYPNLEYMSNSRTSNRG